MHRERVERVAVARRVDLGFENRQPGLAEEAADAREQLLADPAGRSSPADPTPARDSARSHDRLRVRRHGSSAAGHAMRSRQRCDAGSETLSSFCHSALARRPSGHRVQPQLACRPHCVSASRLSRRPRVPARAGQRACVSVEADPRAASPSTRSRPAGSVPRMSATVSR